MFSCVHVCKTNELLVVLVYKIEQKTVLYASVVQCDILDIIIFLTALGVGRLSSKKRRLC